MKANNNISFHFTTRWKIVNISIPKAKKRSFWILKSKEKDKINVSRIHSQEKIVFQFQKQEKFCVFQCSGYKIQNFRLSYQIVNFLHTTIKPLTKSVFNLNGYWLHTHLQTCIMIWTNYKDTHICAGALWE